VSAARSDGGTDKVTIGFRPEHTELVGQGDGGIPVIVELVEELGSDAFVHGHAALTLGDETRDTLVVRTDGRVVPQIGDTVYLRPRAGSQHVFHAGNGARL